MTTSVQLEREAETARSQIVTALSELRERMTPGRIVDETFDFARDGRAGQFVRNLGRQAGDNPLPVVLIGAGLAWLMMGRGTRESSGALAGRSRSMVSTADAEAAGVVSDASYRAAQAGGQAREMASEMASGISSNVDTARRTVHEGDRAGAAASGLAERTGAAGFSAGQAASSVADKAADFYNRTGQSTHDATGGLASFVKEQPIVLAGIGVVIGALLGAAFPATAIEDRMMGDTSDALKEGAAGAVQQQWEKGKAAASHAAEQALEEVKEAMDVPGLVPSGKHENAPSGV